MITTTVTATTPGDIALQNAPDREARNTSELPAAHTQFARQLQSTGESNTQSSCTRLFHSRVQENTGRLPPELCSRLFESTAYERLTFHCRDDTPLRKAISALDPGFLAQLQGIIEKRDWNAADLKSAAAYHGCVALYGLGQVTRSQFMEASYILELMELAGCFDSGQGHPHLDVEHFEVTDLARPENAEQNQCFHDLIASKKELPFVMALQQLEQANAPIEVICMKLSEADNETLKKVHNYYFTDTSCTKPTQTPKTGLFWHLALFAQMSHGQHSLDRDMRTIYFPSIPLVEKVLSHLPYPCEGEPVFGTTSAADLKRLRQEDIHPIIFYNPALTDNFLSPHEHFAGTAMGTSHDLYHLGVQRCIPLEIRRLFLRLDRYEVELSTIIDDWFYSNKSLNFPQNFRAYFTQIHALIQKHPKAIQHYKDLANLTMNKSFPLNHLVIQDDERNFLDQDFYFSLHENLSVNFVKISSGSLRINTSRHTFWASHLRFHYLMFRLAQEHPEDLEYALNLIEDCQKELSVERKKSEVCLCDASMARTMKRALKSPDDLSQSNLEALSKQIHALFENYAVLSA